MHGSSPRPARRSARSRIDRSESEKSGRGGRGRSSRLRASSQTWVASELGGGASIFVCFATAAFFLLVRSSLLVSAVATLFCEATGLEEVAKATGRAVGGAPANTTLA